MGPAIATIAITTWLVVGFRWLCGTSVSLSGVFDDASFVLGLTGLQCVLLRSAGARRGLRTGLGLMPVLLASLFFFSCQLHFAFFRTYLDVSSLRLAFTAVDAQSSVLDLINLANVGVLLAAPIAAQIVALRVFRHTDRDRTGSASAYLFATLLLAGLAGVVRHDVFIFPDHNPIANLVRDAGRRIWIATFGSASGEFDRDAFALFNRNGYSGYELTGERERPLYQHVVEELPSRPFPNVVLILMESVRAFEMQGDFRSLPVTPNLNALEAHSVVFPRFYYNGMRTVDGEYAILCSALPLVNEPPIYVSRAQLDIRCLPEILQERGYQTHWISAYRASYSNKRTFLSGHGMKYIHDEASMDRARARHPDIGWGMSDLDMFEQALEKMENFREPFFAELMTLSNHHPFDHDYGIEMPASFAKVLGTKHYRNYLSGVHYTDHAIGRFLEAARAKPWFERTLFVILGDHSVRTYPRRPDGSSYGPVLETEVYFRGKLILYGPGWLAPGRSDVLGSQIDVAPTLLDILGIRADNSFLGVSLLAPIAPERRFALTAIGHVWNMVVGNRYCYSVGYSCFENVFPRCRKGVKPSFAGHTCFETSADLLDAASLDEVNAQPLEGVEREEVLGRARRIIEVNNILVREDRFR